MRVRAFRIILPILLLIVLSSCFFPSNDEKSGAGESRLPLMDLDKPERIEDKFSYAYGYLFASTIEEQPDIREEYFLKGMLDYFGDPFYDEEEIDDILSVADGIGISSVSDMDPGYIEAVADAVRERRMVFAIHVSERVREDIDFVLSLDPAFVVHMCEATDSDILKCAEAEVPIVVCPTSNRYFGKVPPIARAEALGADLAIGTDNGMIRSPDMVAEALEFARTAEAQGGDPETVWSALWKLSGKILNQHRNILNHNGTDVLSVIPTEDFDALSALGGKPEAVALDENTKRL